MMALDVLSTRRWLPLTREVAGVGEDPGRSIDGDSVRREDLVTSLLAMTLVAGLFLDGWNHLNLQGGALGSFFTIWHALLYTGFTATASWIVTRNPHLYRRACRPKPYFHIVCGIPLRYPLAVVGLALAAVGMVGDIGWHTAFGAERGVARVIAPFHLLLFAGAAGLVSAPFRSGWYAPDHYPSAPSFRTIFPPLLSLALVSSVAAFMFQWFSVFLDWAPPAQAGQLNVTAGRFLAGADESESVARVVVTNLILMSPLFLALRRWRLPFGSAALLFGFVALSMDSLSGFAYGARVIATVFAGLVADAVLYWLDPGPGQTLGYRVVAGLTPLTLWTAYFLVLKVGGSGDWPLDLWLGTTGLAVICGVLLSYVAIPPAVPARCRTADLEEGES